MNIRTFVAILSRNLQYNFPKMRGGRGGVKGRLELFRKFIRFGNVRRCPLFWCWWLEDGEVAVDFGGWAAMLPRVQLGATCPQLAFLAQHSKSAGAWPGYGQQAAAGERGQQAAPTWTHNPAFSPTHLLLLPQAVHCIAAYAAFIFYLRYTLSLCVSPL